MAKQQLLRVVMGGAAKDLIQRGQQTQQLQQQQQHQWM
jgi:hypothetical protein